MGFSIVYRSDSGRIIITASGGPYYYRAICRKGPEDGTGETVYDSVKDVGYIPLTDGSSYTTSWFDLEPETTYTANVLFYSTDSSSSYVGMFGAEEFTTPERVYNVYATLTYDANGGSGAPRDQTLRDQSASSPYAYVSGTLRSGVPEKQGYTFLGWQLSGYQHALYSPGDSITVPGSTSGITYTLIAQWSQIVPEFDASMTATGQTTALLDASFENGGSGYYYHRWARVYLKASYESSYTSYGDIQDDLTEAQVNAGQTSNCNFSGTISGLLSGTQYYYRVVLCYQANGSRAESSYVETGSFTTAQSFVTPYIFNGSSWVLAQPYVFDGNTWVPASPRLYTDNQWK